MIWDKDEVVRALKKLHRSGVDLSYNALAKRKQSLVSAAAYHFGSYRKAVKHTTDNAANQISAKSISRSISALNAITPPADIHHDVARRPGKPESQLYRLGSKSKIFPLLTHHETDQDYHLVIADQVGAALPLDGGPNAHRMVVEIVALSCSNSSPFLTQITNAKSAFTTYVNRCGSGKVKIGRSTWTKLRGTAVIEGVGFWDYPHALGHDTGIEIHPVTAFTGSC